MSFYSSTIESINLLAITAKEAGEISKKVAKTSKPICLGNSGIATSVFLAICDKEIRKSTSNCENVAIVIAGTKYRSAIPAATERLKSLGFEVEANEEYSFIIIKWEDNDMT
jgi:hypothetical protein